MHRVLFKIRIVAQSSKGSQVVEQPEPDIVRVNPRTRRVRHAILDAAFDVLLTEGAECVTATRVAERADVAEELDRLSIHVAEARNNLSGNGPHGRRLDFLTQELNREANTLGSKSTMAETSQKAVDLKVVIEQIREQVQNIE